MPSNSGIFNLEPCCPHDPRLSPQPSPRLYRIHGRTTLSHSLLQGMKEKKKKTEEKDEGES
jgi:hypothetical protein